MNKRACTPNWLIIDNTVTEMDKDKHEDIEDNVWNASGVILDIDSGALIPMCSFSSQC